MTFAINMPILASGEMEVKLEIFNKKVFDC
jgi:hypothetical protein